MFIFRFLCLFIFCKHKQLPMVAQFFKGYASPEVTWPKEVATDLTFLTSYLNHIHWYPPVLESENISQINLGYILGYILDIS
jgi:hypothetical protein